MADAFQLSTYEFSDCARVYGTLITFRGLVVRPKRA